MTTRRPSGFLEAVAALRGFRGVLGLAVAFRLGDVFGFLLVGVFFVGGIY
jgi:hypothetical protein